MRVALHTSRAFSRRCPSARAMRPRRRRSSR
jgi:hypothetical protein